MTPGNPTSTEITEAEGKFNNYSVSSPIPSDFRLLEMYAAEKARQSAETEHVVRYASASNPDALLKSAIFEILASTASSVLDRELSDPKAPFIKEWQIDMRTRLQKRLEGDYGFGQLVRAQSAMIVDEVEAYKKATGLARTHLEGDDDQSGVVTMIARAIRSRS